jgi:hypothetical protein
VKLDGVDATVEDNAAIVFERGTEDVAWQSVHSLGTGEPLFDTFVPFRKFSISQEVQTPRYVGFDVPPDDASDERLRDPKVIGVLAYAAPERVIRRLLVTCSDPQRAALLRSYWDTTRSLSLVQGASSGKPEGILIWWSETYLTLDPPTVPNPASISIVDDDLDVTHAQLPACIALAPWSP